MRPPTSLEIRHAEQSRLAKDRRRYAEKWRETEEGKRQLAVSAEFSALWRAELKTLEDAKKR